MLGLRGLGFEGLHGFGFSVLGFRGLGFEGLHGFGFKLTSNSRGTYIHMYRHMHAHTPCPPHKTHTCAHI